MPEPGNGNRSHAWLRVLSQRSESCPGKEYSKDLWLSVAHPSLPAGYTQVLMPRFGTGVQGCSPSLEPQSQFLHLCVLSKGTQTGRGQHLTPTVKKEFKKDRCWLALSSAGGNAKQSRHCGK